MEENITSSGIWKADKDNDPINDYRYLAQRFDWKKVFSSYHDTSGKVRLLDIACGAGRWLRAFLYYVSPSFPASQKLEIVYDLLDRAKPALLKAADRIDTPFVPGRQYICSIQDAELRKSFYDIIWCMHGFYAIPRGDLDSILLKITGSLREHGTAYIALATRESFYVRCYDEYLRWFGGEEQAEFTCTEDIVEVLQRLGIQYREDTIRYHERLMVSDIQGLDHYIRTESIMNSFGREGSEDDAKEFIGLEELLRHREMGRFLRGFIRDGHYHFPEEIRLISFGNPPARTAVVPLWPNGEEMKRLMDAAIEYVIPHQEHPDQFPLAGSGFEWIHRKTINDHKNRCAACASAFAGTEEPLPEMGSSDIDGLLRKVCHELALCGTNDNGGGYLAYIPSGGLFHAALADFISLSINRYTSMFMAAPGFAAIENQTIRWLCDIVEFPRGAGGVMTSGGSVATLTAIHVARVKRLPTLTAAVKGIAYVSEQGHHCIEEGLSVCGFRTENLRKIGVDEQFRIRMDLLEQAIERDKRTGLHPFLLVGMAGTTNTGAVDDLGAMNELARRHNLWFHVDAAYGGFFLLTERGRVRMEGIRLADSIVLDPHKSLFLPYGTGALLVRDQADLGSSFPFSGTYMHTAQEYAPDDIMSLSPELTRDFRGLRVWLPIKMLGIKPFRDQLDEKLDLAQWMAQALSRIPHIRVVASPQLSIFAFKLHPPGEGDLDGLNKRFLDAINRRGNILLSPFRDLRYPGGFAIRVAILSFRTTLIHLEQGVWDIRETAREVLDESVHRAIPLPK